MEQRFSDNETRRRDIPSFIEPRPPLIQNPFMRPRPQKGTNLLEQFELDSEIEEPELVQVYLRIKPCDVPSNLYEVRSGQCLVTSLDTTTAGHGRRTQHNVSRVYKFSRIFKPECSQKEIFEEVVKDNLKKLPEGHSFTLLTYGASGSGKTYTLMGTVSSPGLVPRSLEYVFKLVDAAQMPTFKPSDNGADQLSYSQQDSELQWVKRLRQVSAPLRDKYRRMSVQLHNDLTVSNLDLSKRAKHYVWVSFVEIYNEAIYDLLAPQKRVKMRIREDSSGNVYVKGVTHAFVRSGEEAYDVMVAGKHNLIVASTGIHAQSSRSHCIFTITMLTEHDDEIRASHVRLCDLAGSERQRATRNTGTRMQESRSINSSLHVLERCLHMLRRNQRGSKENMVPYRESKLTRLLGSGLSGSRGEAVAMVVTLNPAPQYSHETKHVLSLAAVAQDIQINNTVFASTLSTMENSSTQDSSIYISAEVMKLREENDRLHFELLRADKEIQASRQKSQQQSTTTWELVEEAKAIMKQYYEGQIDTLKTKMEEMKEEYESRLAKPESPVTSGPSQYLQAKVDQLMRELAIMENKLSEEKEARVRLEKEVQHLRDCVDERDEKAFSDEAEIVQEVVTDSDPESDDESSDFMNESLEPVFKKECRKRSHIHENKPNHETSTLAELVNETIEENIAKESDCVRDNENTLKNETVDENKNSSNTVGEVIEIVDDNNPVESACNSLSNSSQTISNINDKSISSIIDRKDSNVMNDTNEDKDRSQCEELFYESTKLQDETLVRIKNSITSKLRGTHFIKNDEPKEEYNNDEPEAKDIVKETYFVEKTALDSQNKINVKSVEKVHIENKQSTSIIFKPKKVSETLVSKIMQSLKISSGRDSSLTQFEQLEMAANNVDSSKDKSTDFIDIKMSKEKKTYFEDSANKGCNKPTVFNNPTVIDQFTTRTENSNEHDISLKDNNFLSSAAKIQEKQLLYDSLEKSGTLSVDDKQRESNIKDKDLDAEPMSSAVKIQEKQLYFDDIDKTSSNDILLSSSSKNKRMYFDNIDGNVSSPANKKLNDIIIHSLKDQDRSPSIVKDDIDKYCEPSTLKKILGKSFTKPELSSSVQKNKLFVKKHESVDIFESPQINTAKGKDIGNIEIVSDTAEEAKKHNVEITPVIKVDERNNVEVVCKTIENLVLEHKAHAEVKQEIKLEPALSIEEPATKYVEEPVASSFISSKDSKECQVKITIKTEQALNDTVKENNTIDEFENICKDLTNTRAAEFENICKDLTNTRATEFDLLLSQDVNASDTKDKAGEPESNPTYKDSKIHDKEISEKTKRFEEAKYNLRYKDKKEKDAEEFSIKSHSKCERKTTIKRSLRLRKRKIPDEENSDQENENKIKDIVNLEKEFSDVITGLPAMKKEVKDIPSPEKLPGEEDNLPPMMGIQSCPSKSVTRSRRKLFTPRAEPLEESLSQAGDSNERVHVPRPSYHRVRARRKL